MCIIFGEILKQLRIEKNLTQKDLGNFFNVKKNTVCNWEKGIREPDYETLKQLAIYFDVPTDYLLGLADEYGNALNQVPHLKVAAREKPKSK